jgi:tol-pal system protein YbgF
MAIRGLVARGEAVCLPARRRPAPLSARLHCLLLLGLPLLVGCGAHIHLPDRVAEMQAQLTDLERREESTARQIEELKALLAQQELLLREIRADQNADLGEIRNSIEIIRNQLEHTSRQLSRSPSRRPGPPATPSVISESPPDSSVSPALEEEGLYQAALQNLQQGRYPLAITGFREYLSKFPEGALGDEAQYGIAEAYYAQSDFPTAAIEFRALIDRHPESDKVPAALLKAGMSYFESGKEDLGRAYLERVINEHPFTDEALKARERLERRR